MSRINVDTVLARNPYGANPVAMPVRYTSKERKKLNAEIDRLTKQISRDKKTLQKHIEQRQQLINKLNKVE